MIQKPKQKDKIRYVATVDFVRGSTRIKPGEIGTVVSKIVREKDNELFCSVEFKGVRVQFERNDYDKLEFVNIQLVNQDRHPSKDKSFCIFHVSGGEKYKVTATPQTLKGFGIDLETACRMALECHLEQKKVPDNEFDVQDYYLEIRQRYHDDL